MRLTLFLFLLTAGHVFAQPKTITLYKTFGGVRFERDSLILSPKQVQYMLEEDAIALSLFKKARINSATASILGFAGGVLIGIPVGTALLGGNPEWGLALGGATLIGVSIPFNRLFIRQAQQAIDRHNQLGSVNKLKPEIFWAGNQAGLRLRL